MAQAPPALIVNAPVSEVIAKEWVARMIPNSLGKFTTIQQQQPNQMQTNTNIMTSHQYIGTSNLKQPSQMNFVMNG